MKIAFLLPCLRVYGAIRMMVDFSNEMVDRNHEVMIYQGDGGLSEWVEVAAEIKPANAVLESAHDVVIVNLRAMVGLLGLCEAKLKMYLTSDRWSPHDEKYQKMLDSSWVKLAPTRWVKGWLSNKGVLSHYLPIGVNRKLFYPVEKRASSGGVLQLLWSGDERHGKGFTVLRGMSQILKERGVNFKLSSYYGKDIPQSEMAKVYGKASVFIDVPLGDSALRNNPVLEAMACGVPVICTNHESVLEWGVHGETVFMIKKRDSAVLADAVITLSKDQNLMRKLRLNALKKTDEFTWSKTGNEFEKIIKKEMKRTGV